MSTADLSGARRELFGRGSVYTIGSVLQAASAFLVVPVVTRLLPPAEFGAVAAATVIVQLLGLVLALGLPSVIMLERLQPDGAAPDRARRLIGTTVIAAVVGAAGLHATAPWWSAALRDLDGSPVVVLAVWAAVPGAVLAATQALLRADRRPGSFILVGALVTFGAPACGMVAVVAGTPTSATYFSGFLAGATVGGAVALVLVRAARPRPGDRDLVLRSLRVALPMVPHSVALFALLAIDRLIIEGTVGLEAAGRYQIAYVVGGAGLSLLAAVNNAWSPVVIGAPHEDRDSILAATSVDLERLTVVVTGAIALGAPFALRLLAPARYEVEELTPLVGVIAASALPYLWYLGAGHVLLAERATSRLAHITPSVAAASVGGGLLAIPRWGLAAAAVITVLSYLLLAIAVRRTASRLIAVPWDHASTTRATGLVAVAVAFGALLPATGAAACSRAAVMAVLVVAVMPSRLQSRWRLATPVP